MGGERLYQSSDSKAREKEKTVKKKRKIPALKQQRAQTLENRALKGME